MTYQIDERGNSIIHDAHTPYDASRKPATVDTSMAEKWLDPDHFVYRGRVYELGLDFKIRQSPPGVFVYRRKTYRVGINGKVKIEKGEYHENITRNPRRTDRTRKTYPRELHKTL